MGDRPGRLRVGVAGPDGALRDRLIDGLNRSTDVSAVRDLDHPNASMDAADARSPDFGRLVGIDVVCFTGADDSRVALVADAGLTAILAVPGRSGRGRTLTVSGLDTTAVTCGSPSILACADPIAGQLALVIAALDVGDIATRIVVTSMALPPGGKGPGTAAAELQVDPESELRETVAREQLPELLGSDGLGVSLTAPTVSGPLIAQLHAVPSLELAEPVDLSQVEEALRTSTIVDYRSGPMGQAADLRLAAATTGRVLVTDLAHPELHDGRPETSVLSFVAVGPPRIAWLVDQMVRVVESQRRGPEAAC